MKKTLTIAVVTIILGMGFFCAIAFLHKSYAHDQYVCTVCGLRRSVIERRLGHVPYHRVETIHSTAVSRVLRRTDCLHKWLFYKFGRGTGTVLAGYTEHADGGTKSTMMPFLLIDNKFAGELGAMQNPSQVWGTLLLALTKSQKLDDSLSRWWMRGRERVPFAAWWKENAAGIQEQVSTGKN